MPSAMSPGRASSSSCSTKTCEKSLSLPIAVSSARVGGQRRGGQRAPLLDDRMQELDGDVLRVARRAAVAHHPAGGRRARKRSAIARTQRSSASAFSSKNRELRASALSRTLRRMRLALMRRLRGPRRRLACRDSGRTGSRRRRRPRPTPWSRRAGAAACTRGRRPGSRHGFFRPRRTSPLMQSGGLARWRSRRPRRAARRRARGTRSAACSPTSGSTPTPRHLRSPTSNTSKISVARRRGCRRARRRARTGSRPRRAPPRAGARPSGCPRGDRPARSR